MQDRRKYASAKRFKVREEAGIKFIQYMFDDLSDDELQPHFDRAMENQDFEYAHAVSAEMITRNIKVKYS